MIKCDVLVVGGAGFLGRYVTEYFTSQNKRVVIIDDFSVGRWRSIPNVIIQDVRNVDFRNFEAETIVMLAALVNSKDFIAYPFTSFEIILRPLFDACKYFRNLIFFSSSEIYNDVLTFDQRTGYDFAKIAGEALLFCAEKEQNVNVKIVRPYNVYGPYAYRDCVITKFLTQVYTGNPVTIYGNGRQIRTFTYIDDFMRCFDLFLNSSLREIDIAGSQSVSINDLVEIMKQTLPKEFSVAYVDPPFDEQEIRLPQMDGMKKLNFRPQISLEKGLVKTYKWVKNEKLLGTACYRR